MTRSNYPRREGDRYWTEPWVTRALVRAVPEMFREGGFFWEPACGRGDMVSVLHESGRVVASDVDMSDFEYDDAPTHETYEHDFLADQGDNYALMTINSLHAVVTNPPYGRRAVQFAEMVHALIADHSLTADRYSSNMWGALLLRTEFSSAAGRTHLFRDSPYFRREVRLLRRPRWDDWRSGEPPKAAPRHNYSWYVWSAFGDGREPVAAWEDRE